ncbi:hypothetical protein H8356DRAFT_1352470 [Neocallimastix lanati (nom. inval.)]|nr:hypothetical protein H8356DRAFT_1352470 [Neocallimastix sp. JGI-2020a]
MQLGEIQHFNNTPLGEIQSGEMQLSPVALPSRHGNIESVPYWHSDVHIIT